MPKKEDIFKSLKSEDVTQIRLSEQGETSKKVLENERKKEEIEREFNFSEHNIEIYKAKVQLK